MQKYQRHHLSSTRIYSTWADIKTRCYNKKAENYKKYGAKGVTICEEWKNDFTVFYKWAIANGYKDNLQIDRIKPSGNYEPLNCRWTNTTVQARNTRAICVKNTSGYRGVSYVKRDKVWLSQIRINNKLIHLGSFKDAEKAAIAYIKYVEDNNLEHNYHTEKTKELIKKYKFL